MNRQREAYTQRQAQAQAESGTYQETGTDTGRERHIPRAGTGTGRE